MWDNDDGLKRYTEEVQKSFNKAVLPEPGKNVKIVATNLGDDAPLYGGIALAEEFLN